ncbi:ribonuclease P protein component [Alcaligenes sp. SORT26]|uniref:Ribonuclease P protein component n=2 Tax=Alcaligenes parafaecalis TaxID=171260 RepID=A0ABT3VTZ9_9BURK|nr:MULTISPECIES: ribonuclease P protein component [Alcaligenes]MCX5465700.1 ribonuclease P protein component [Alcaligenes parafaecalis]QTC01835.1 ribonuclease P protein component [Alcaligenes sp. SORT26]
MMRASFPATARLHSPTEYAQSLKGQRVGRGALFVVTRSRGEDPQQTEGARLGLIVPKRFANRAVTRNTIKRILRETFRHKREGLPNAAYVFRLHSKVPLVSLTALKQLVRTEAETLFSKVRP